MTSFFRYPGGKAKLRNKIIEKIIKTADKNVEYCEPFFGGGSIGLNLVDYFSNIWVNDIDFAISCVWNSVHSYPFRLIEKIHNYKPTVEQFYEIKKQLLEIKPDDSTDIVDTAFKKIVIHQTSYSGLGTKSGGPLGGAKQQSKYKIDCRWSPDYIVKKIIDIHKKLSSINFQCTNCEFQHLLSCNEGLFFYLDPPYFVKGNELYQHGFTLDDHLKLAKCLQETPNPWVLSYDDCKEIRELYEWADIESLDVTYTITGKKDKITGNRQSQKKGELLICPKK